MLQRKAALFLVLILTVSMHAAAAPSAPADVILSAAAGQHTVGTVILEPEPRADGYYHIDTPAMIERLKALGVNHYTYTVWQSPTDWDDLRYEFLPAAEQAGIDVWVMLAPPSQCYVAPEPHRSGGCSLPYETDYVKWAEAIADLSLEYPNLTGWLITDIMASANQSVFTRGYLEEIRAVQDALNPDLSFYGLLYNSQINASNVALLGGALDGVVYPYRGFTNSAIDPTWLERRLDPIVAQLEGSGLDLVLLVYAGRYLNSVMHPQEGYVAEVLHRAEPYVRDGRLKGIIAYGTPLDLDLPQPSFDYWAHSGPGRLSFSVGYEVPTTTGSYARATQRITVDPDAAEKTLVFYHRDQYEVGRLRGYMFKQVLIDGQVVWEEDVSNDARDEWIRTEVDLTEALAGKTEAELTFRLYHKQGVFNWPFDMGLDSVSAVGFTVQNGGFDEPGGWEIEHTHDNMFAFIDIYAADRPVRIFNAVGEAFARLKGEDYEPVPPKEFPDLRLGPGNRAMYGNGWLSLTIPAHRSVAAGAYASASQVVKVQPGLDRYELSFWHTDTHLKRSPGYLFKEVLIDGELVWASDAADMTWWYYINGHPEQGPIDVTEFVKGKDEVELTFRIRADQDIQVGGAFLEQGIEVSFDHIRTVGLDVVNPGFETNEAWVFDTVDPLTAAIAMK